MQLPYVSQGSLLMRDGSASETESITKANNAAAKIASFTLDHGLRGRRVKTRTSVTSTRSFIAPRLLVCCQQRVGTTDEHTTPNSVEGWADGYAVAAGKASQWARDPLG
jgi:hypothetical protein